MNRRVACTVACACACAFAACSLSLDGFTSGAGPTDGGADAPAADATPDGADVDSSTDCGAKDCLGGACNAGRCAPAILASNQAGARGIALHGDDVYWVTSGGALRRMPKHGGTVETLQSGGSKPVAIAVDDSGIYVTDEGSSEVDAITLDGSAATAIATGQTAPSGIALDATYVYYVTAGEARRVPKNGSSVPTRLGTASDGAD
ncbi:MAG TPA: hypothetical protein VIF62_39080, partial [Labilithrix sp.]